MRRITPEAAKVMVHAPIEMAFLDVKEAGQFGEDHPLFAVPCPYSQLETRVVRLVPRRSTAIVLIDAGDGVAERAAERLQTLGYRDISVIEGGIAGWQRQGFTLFKGVNVPSKTLGELAEQIWHPETVDAATLQQWQAEGTADIFDARPPGEFFKMHVPGATCLPNGELAHRLNALARPEKRPLIVGCAGRTRGIVGAIGLKLLGYDGPIYALENGTQGWALAGLELERGVQAAPFTPLDKRSQQEARKRADTFLRRWDIPTVSATDVRHMLDEPHRTTFVFDVRTADEAKADPVLAANHAPSGQLVQATDHYVAVRHARLILCDNLGIRAGLAAFWLRQLGYEPVVALIDDDLRSLSMPERMDEQPDWQWEEPGPALAQAESGEALLIDLRSTGAFRRCHVRRAIWSIRPRLRDTVADDERRLLLIADDKEVLSCAASDLREADTNFAVVRGGQEALAAQGARLETTPSVPDDADAIDFLQFVHDRHDGNLEASRRYLAWERGLIAQLDAEERAEFQLSCPSG